MCFVNDTGKTFTKTQLKLKNGGNLDGRRCESVKVDPNLGHSFLAGSGWDFSKEEHFRHVTEAHSGNLLIMVVFDSLNLKEGSVYTFDPSSVQWKRYTNDICS